MKRLNLFKRSTKTRMASKPDTSWQVRNEIHRQVLPRPFSSRQRSQYFLISFVGRVALSAGLAFANPLSGVLQHSRPVKFLGQDVVRPGFPGVAGHAGVVASAQDFGSQFSGVGYVQLLTAQKASIAVFELGLGRDWMLRGV